MDSDIDNKKNVDKVEAGDSQDVTRSSLGSIKKESFEEVKESKLRARLTLDDEQIADLKKAFNLLDYDGVGKILSSNFRVAIKALGFEPSKAELSRMVKEVDVGNTGRMSFENFLTAIMRKVAERDTEDEMMKSFRLMDDDDSGSISFENIKRVTEILEHYLTDEEIQEMLDDADKDLDEQISPEEFIKMMKRTVSLATP